MIQHFVPKVYLKNFGIQIRDEYFVDVYDKNENRFFNTNIKNICSEKNIYTLSDESNIAQDKLVFEKFFSRFIEPMYQKCYELLTNDKIFLISKNQRIELLLGLFQLYSRNPNIFKRIIDRDNYVIKRLYDKAIQEGQESIEYRSNNFNLTLHSLDSILQSNIEQTINYFKEQHVKALSQIGTAHEDIIIHVSKIRDNSKFISGDNPMPYVDGLSDSINPLLNSKEFYITLSQNYCVHLFHDRLKNPYEILRSSIPNGSVASINEKVFNQSRRFVVGTKKAIEEYFVMARRMDNLTVSEAMDLIEQAIKIGPHPSEPDYRGAMPDVLNHFLSLYIKQGDLTSKQFFRLQKISRRISSEIIKKRLK